MLYRTESKGIQAWILGSGKLREIAGGSQAVEAIVQLARRQAEYTGGQVLYAAAGGATIRFPKQEQLASFARWWPMAVAARAPGLSVIQAWAEDDDWAELRQRLAAATIAKAPDLPEAGPLLSRSGRSGLPAVARGKDGIEDRSTRARLAAYAGGRDRLAQVLLDDQMAFLEDLDGFPNGYLALVHADANGIGQLFAQAKVKDASRFSDQLAEATRMAARVAVGTLPRKDGRVLARPVVLGGDDFSIIVPAPTAIRFARAFLESFEQETAIRAVDLGSKLTACAGIAVVKPGWPFVDAHDLAESLCKVAKDRFRHSGASGLAFHRVTTALTDDWEALRVGPLASADAQRVLTANPYSLEEVDKLERLADAAMVMPRGALRRWVDMARVDLARAQEQWDRMREVVKAAQPGRLADFDLALTECGADASTGWGATATPVYDCLEWRRIVARSQNWGEDRQ